GGRVPAGDRMADALFEIDGAALAEIGAQGAGLRIDRDQAGVDRVHEQAAGAEVGFGQVGGFVIGEATAGGVVGDGVGGDLRVVAPDFGASGGVEGDDLVHGRAQIQPVADLDGRVLVGEALVALG